MRKKEKKKQDQGLVTLIFTMPMAHSCNGLFHEVNLMHHGALQKLRQNFGESVQKLGAMFISLEISVTDISMPTMQLVISSGNCAKVVIPSRSKGFGGLCLHLRLQPRSRTMDFILLQVLMMKNMDYLDIFPNRIFNSLKRLPG